MSKDNWDSQYWPLGTHLILNTQRTEEYLYDLFVLPRTDFTIETVRDFVSS